MQIKTNIIEDFTNNLLDTIKYLGYYLTDIDEYYIKCNIILNSPILLGKGESLYGVLTNLNIPDSKIQNNLSNMLFEGWITFTDHSYIKRVKENNIESWKYFKFPKLNYSYYHME